MDWTPVSYQYDGSFAGFLTCVFESYAHREEPMCFTTQEDGRFSLWPERTVDTHEVHARRVYQSLAQKLGPQGRQWVIYGFLTCLEEKELHLWRFLRLGYQRGPGVVGDLADDRVSVLFRAVRRLTGEAHQYKGFLRFSQQEGVLVGEIAPKNRVLPLLRPHFCARYSGESFLICDRTHREALFYRPRQWAILPLEELHIPPPSPEERDYRLLWRRFYDTIAIPGRENPRCRMTHMPRRFWAHMTEFQSEGRKELTDEADQDHGSAQTALPRFGPALPDPAAGDVQL